MVVVCKYYRQGNCRYGQYCQYEHINNFVPSKTESYNEEEATVILVATDVLIAERGGQWLLSCFGPFPERPCIPGMDDLSPEEARWEMYQAQKNGVVEEARLRFQQLCQDMKVKRDALKNPTHETIAMLKKVVGPASKGSNVIGKSNFSFAAPQLNLPTSTSASNVFGNKTFSSQSNIFSSGFNATSSAPIFGRAQNNAAPVFGGTATFGTGLGFGNASNTTTAFGDTKNASIFNSVPNTQPFGTIVPPNNSVFGGNTTQSVFGQPSTFGTTNQVTNVFARPQTTQSTSVFDPGSTPNSLFGNSLTSQTNTALFGNKTSTTNIFGGSPNITSTGTVFGGTTSAGPLSNTSASIFGQSKTASAFGGAPIFGGVSNFNNNPTGSIFGGQGTFTNSALSTGNTFGGCNTATSTFGSINQTPNTFGSTTSVSSPTVFGGAQNTGPVISAAGSIAFSSVTSTTSAPFGINSPQPDSTSTTSTLFSRPTFGLPVTGTNSTFGVTVTSGTAPFGSAITGTAFTNVGTTVLPFPTSTFNGSNASHFAPTSTTVTTTTTNPFAPRTQQINSPFGVTPPYQVTVNSSPFGKSPFSTTLATAVDDTVYTMDGQLTDDEKSMYLAKQFSLGKIPLKPPTKDIR